MAGIPQARLVGSKLLVEEGHEELASRDYGKQLGSRLELSLPEALYLLEGEKITVKYTRKLTFKSLLRRGLASDPRLLEKYTVYKDIRDRGLVAKTGFKFGCDFRVYRRGVSVKKGPKAPAEHTRWIVIASTEDSTFSFSELSRAVRLAHSIRARMLWAVVDNEANVTYYEVVRVKP